ncbi:MAG: sigma-70 family RNA polymerase sigma factor [Ktedonobacteraceae bacterium]
MGIQQPQNLESLQRRVEVHPCPSHEQSDEYLLHALACGVKGAMEPLYRRHCGLLFSLTYRMIGSHEVAEELVQETFLAVWQHANSYSPQAGQVRSWLISLTRHHTIDYLRKMQRRACSKEVLWEELEWERDATSPDVWENVWREEQRLRVREALLQLPYEQRIVITLAYFHGWTHMEIAHRCELPIGTVKSRLRLGLLHLKQALDPLYADELPSSGNTQRKQALLREAAPIVVQKTESGCPTGYELYRNGTCRCFGYTQWEPLVEQIDAFEFHGATGSFTARKEKQLNGQFCWYAYQWCGKRKKKRYLGKSFELTVARMEDMGKRLG